MTATTDADSAPIAQQGSSTDWTAVVRKLGPGFASRAAGYDANDSFVAENYTELKEHKVFSIGVPAELGGGGASHAELCGLLREMGRYCGSTALALSMHTHLVGTLTWMWRQGRPVGPLLERIAANELVLVTTGASDWLDSSGNAERVDGGTGSLVGRSLAAAPRWATCCSPARRTTIPATGRRSFISRYR